MDELVQWLGEQFDEDEQVARDACHGGPANWTTDGSYPVSVAGLPRGADVFTEAVAFDEGSPSEAQAEHIALHDPARVLREIDAKRRIATQMASTLSCAAGDSEVDHYGALVDAEQTLRLLALPYADRPGYREEWRP